MLLRLSGWVGAYSRVCVCMCERECGCDVIIEMLDMLVFVLSLGEISFRSTILKSEKKMSGFTLLKSEKKTTENSNKFKAQDTETSR